MNQMNIREPRRFKIHGFFYFFRNTSLFIIKNNVILRLTGNSNGISIINIRINNNISLDFHGFNRTVRYI